MIEEYQKFERYQRDILKDSILKFFVFQISTIRNIEYDVGKIAEVFIRKKKI